MKRSWCVLGLIEDAERNGVVDAAGLTAA